MTSPDAPDTSAPPTPAELQFDHAEFAAPHSGAVVCKACSQTIPQTYYEVNSNILCDRCRSAIESQLQGGSGVVRFLRASLFGLGAALAGTALYYLVLAVSGLEIGLIAIVVGMMVGAAVRAGSRHRGGWFYQTLAVFLTYNAIVLSYIPAIVTALSERERADEAAAAAEKASAPQGSPAPGAIAKAADKAAPGAGAQPADSAQSSDTAKAQPSQPRTETPKTAESNPAEEPEERPASPLAVILAMVVVLVFAYALPFLAGAQNLIGLLIIFFGLHQAWRLNRKVKLVINGPFQVGASVPIPQEGTR
jgi:hypothetical protein